MEADPEAPSAPNALTFSPVLPPEGKFSETDLAPAVTLVSVVRKVSLPEKV